MSEREKSSRLKSTAQKSGLDSERGRGSLVVHVGYTRDVD